MYYSVCLTKSKLLALPTIVNGSILNLLKGVPALYTAPLSRSDEFATLERAKELSVRLGESANSAWQKLENALRSWASVAQNRSQLDMRFAERRADTEKKSVVVTVGPVDSHIAASQLCKELGGDVCSHSEFVFAFENNLGGCHSCGWTLSKVKGDAVFLVESMADPDLCDMHPSSGITMCKFDDAKPLPVHCCLSRRD